MYKLNLCTIYNNFRNNLDCNNSYIIDNEMCLHNKIVTIRLISTMIDRNCNIVLNFKIIFRINYWQQINKQIIGSQ